MLNLFAHQCKKDLVLEWIKTCFSHAIECSMNTHLWIAKSAFGWSLRTWNSIFPYWVFRSLIFFPKLLKHCFKAKVKKETMLTQFSAVTVRNKWKIFHLVPNFMAHIFMPILMHHLSICSKYLAKFWSLQNLRFISINWICWIAHGPHEISEVLFFLSRLHLYSITVEKTLTNAVFIIYWLPHNFCTIRCSFRKRLFVVEKKTFFTIHSTMLSVLSYDQI